MRYIRAIYGHDLKILVPDSTPETGTLSWYGGSASITISNCVCTIPASIVAQVPPPLNIGEHTSCKLTIGQHVWEIQLLPDQSNNILEVKYRWQQT